MSKRYFDRGTELWGADPGDPRVIERAWVISQLGEHFKYRQGAVQSSSQLRECPDYLHETPEAAFNYRKRVCISQCLGEIAYLTNQMRLARGRLKKFRAMKAKEIKMPKPQTFERSEWEWSCDY